jgi:CubicO group peptidase (beta-lactamase class C family)
LKKRIVDKIGLNHTKYGGPIEVKNNESLGYFKEDGLWKISQETDMSNPGGAGAIISTSSDLTKFMSALFNGDLISDSSFKIMKTSNNSEVCHGLFYANMDGTDLYASEGGIDGFQSMLIYIPKNQTSIALTANALDYSKMRIMLSALAASNGKPIVLPNFEKISLTTEQLKLYEGTYESKDAPFKLFFKADGITLSGSQDDINFKELTSTKQHQFTLDALGVILDFFPETGVLKFNTGDQPIIFNKL